MTSTASNIASSINLSSLGLGSGLNDASIVSQLVAIESAPITALQATQTNITSASSTISAFSQQLNALQSAANSLADPSQFNSYTATSSASQIVASTAAGTSAGSYQVTVSQLAQAQTTFSDPQSSSTAALSLTGTLGMTIGGQTYSVAVASGDSLADIAANLSSSGAGVTASVIFDGSQYRLDVQGTQTGASNAVTFNESGFTLGLANVANTYQSAQDAEATVDGISVSSQTNQIAGAIPGVTLAITGTTTSAATIAVTASGSGLTSQVQAFVAAYNTVVSAGHSDAGYGTTAASNPLLQSDRGIETSLSQLSSLVTGPIAGADSSLNTLGSIGITLNSNGSLTLDQSTFDQAVQSNPDAVEKLFVNAPGQGMTGIMQSISATIDNLANDPYSPLQAEVSALHTQNTALNTQITDMQTRIQAYQTQLQTEFSATDLEVTDERTLFTDVGGTGTFM